MKESIAYIQALRNVFIELIDSLSIAQINHIPEGFSNNIAWNFGHIIVSGEALAYLKTEVQVELEIPYLKDYVNGSKPTRFIDADEIAYLKKWAKTSIQKIENEMAEGKFSEMKAYQTQSFKIAYTNPDSLLACITAHDALHLGYAKALKNLVKNQ